MTEDHVSRTLALRQPNKRRPCLYQDWVGLTFLHWEVDPGDVAGLLPPGLTVDLWDGTAFVGVVPFTMQNIRPYGLPQFPGLSAFHETNVRVYVRGPDGSPGVWFLSLDAANRVGCWLGRSLFGLNYRFAAMQVSLGAAAEYRSTREEAACHVRSVATGAPSEAQPGTLEFFLVERYLLFSVVRGTLVKGLVYHEPYRMQQATCELCDTNLPEVNGLRVDEPPVSCLYSPGVRTKVFGVERA